jgi:methyltransferase (TIGR00027 family)
MIRSLGLSRQNVVIITLNHREVSMEKDQVSLGALAAAYYRAYHNEHDSPKIFCDHLSKHLIMEDERSRLEGLFGQLFQSIAPQSADLCADRTTALARTMRSIPFPSIALSRSRYAEDCLEAAVEQGVSQFVNLGAGMDTFAFRRPELLERLNVFEIDQPATQAAKQRRIAELGWERPERLHFVPVDFTKESLPKALERSPYDPKAPSFFSWLGVTFYLPREAVPATLRGVAEIAPAGGAIVFDYLDTDAFVPGRAAKRVGLAVDILKQAGEPWITGFDPSRLPDDLSTVGFDLRENLNPSDIQERYFQGRDDGYYACEHLHFALAETCDQV